jgi:hypothetical protein
MALVKSKVSGPETPREAPVASTPRQVELSHSAKLARFRHGHQASDPSGHMGAVPCVIRPATMRSTCLRSEGNRSPVCWRL